MTHFELNYWKISHLVLKWVSLYDLNVFPIIIQHFSFFLVYCEIIQRNQHYLFIPSSDSKLIFIHHQKKVIIQVISNIPPCTTIAAIHSLRWSSNYKWKLPINIFQKPQQVPSLFSNFSLYSKKKYSYLNIYPRCNV